MRTFPLFACSGLALLLACSAASAQQATPLDAAALVHRALVENKHSLDVLRNYLFTGDLTEEDFDKNGRVSKNRTTHSEIFFVDGEPVERVLLENGQPLNEKERQKQEKEIDEKLADASSANPKHREERQKKAAKALQEETDLREDVADAYNFTLVDKELCLGDRRCVRIAGEPRPGFRGKSRYKVLFPVLHGTILIDEDSGQWVDIDAAMLRKVGGGPVYVGAESRIHLHQEPVADGLWVLNQADIRLNARLLWEHKNVHIVAEDSGFRRFGSTTRMIPVTPAAGPAEPLAEPESATKPAAEAH